MGIDILLMLIGIPVSWVGNNTLDKLKSLKHLPGTSALLALFLESFYKSLDHHGKSTYKEGVLQLKKSIKKNETAFIGCLSGLSSRDIITQLQNQTFQKELTAKILTTFPLKKKEENFTPIMEIILQDTLKNWRNVFMTEMNEKQGIQWTIILQELSLETIREGQDELKTQIDTLIQFIRKAEQKEAKKKKKVSKKKKQKRQVKILSLTAAPTDIDGINYEKEQDLLLDTFADFDHEDLHLDMPDPAGSTLDELTLYLEDGFHDILHITAHGGTGDKGRTVLHLEDHRGKDAPTGVQELLKAFPSRRRPKIIILSACHSARPEPHLLSMAESLFKKGIKAVIGMQKAISHDGAVEFNKAFLTALCKDRTVEAAFEAGQAAIQRAEEEQRRGGGEPVREESDIPRLFCGDNGLTRADFSAHRIRRPDRPQSHQFGGARFLERGFIGRRGVLREVFGGVEQKRGAVVLQGPGGIGKSTLTTRAAANLRGKGYEFCAITGETSVENIIETLARKGAELGVKEAEKLPEVKGDPMEKLGWLVEHLLARRRVVLILDNFETNQKEEDGDFLRERLKKALMQLREWLEHKPSLLLISTRYRLPGFEHSGMTVIVPEFTPLEYRKMMRHREGLKGLDSGSLKRLRQEVGGHPRALDLLDRITLEEFQGRAYGWKDLKEVIPELKERLLERAGAGDKFEPLFLGRLLTYLTERQRELLRVLSIYRVPVPREGLEVHHVSLTRPDRLRLTALSLLECSIGERGPLYYVHRLTAGYVLETLDNKSRKDYHIKGAYYFESIRTDEGEKFIENDIEARWHYLEAGEWSRAASLTFDLEDYLSLRGSPHLAMELLSELNLSKLDEEDRGITHNRLGILQQDFGNYNEAMAHFEKSLEIDKKIGDSKGAASNLHHIGMIHQDQGRYEDAVRQYEKSLEIAKKIGDQRGIASTLHQIGRIHQDQGRYEDAVRQYEKSLEIAKKIGDQSGIASTLGQIGIIHQAQGRYDDAVRQYEKALEIFLEIGAQKESAVAMHQIGNIYYLQGRYEDAVRQYEKSLEIKKKIGNQRGIAITLHQIGMIHQLQGRYEDAVRQYEQAISIFKKIGDIASTATVMAQMGTLHFSLEEWEPALEHFIQAFIQFTRLQSPYARNARQDIARVREKMPEEQFLAVLNGFELEPGQVMAQENPEGK